MGSQLLHRGCYSFVQAARVLCGIAVSVWLHRGCYSVAHAASPIGSDVYQLLRGWEPIECDPSFTWGGVALLSRSPWLHHDYSPEILVFVLRVWYLRCVFGFVLSVMDADLCSVCHHRHNPAHRCPVYRRNMSQWLSAAVDAAVPPVPVHTLSAFSEMCPHCRSRSWPAETINCCNGGRVILPIGDVVPSEMQDVILSAHVRANIRRFVAV